MVTWAMSRHVTAAHAPESNGDRAAGERYGCAVPSPLRPTTLTGQHVVLAPLSPEHVDGLVEAAAVDRSTYSLTLVPDGRDEMAAYVEQLLADHAAAKVLPFVQIDMRTG